MNGLRLIMRWSGRVPASGDWGLESPQTSGLASTEPLVKAARLRGSCLYTQRGSMRSGVLGM